MVMGRRPPSAAEFQLSLVSARTSLSRTSRGVLVDVVGYLERGGHVHAVEFPERGDVLGGVEVV